MNSFIVLDAALMEDEIDTALSMEPQHVSLYKGTADEALACVAPYLFRFTKGTDLFNFFLETGWGNSWGILAFSDVSMKAMQKHFRRFLLIKTESGEQLYFRFYDPRVLRLFLPTCDSKQLKDFFGPVSSFVCELEENKAIEFKLIKEALVEKEISKEEVFQQITEEKKTKSWFF